MTREGDAKLTGGVAILQGEREVSAESATYDASERRFEVEGNVEYRSPDLRLKGGDRQLERARHRPVHRRGIRAAAASRARLGRARSR